MLITRCHCAAPVQPSVQPSNGSSGIASSGAGSELSFSVSNLGPGCFCSAAPKRWQITTPVFHSPGPAGCTTYWNQYSGTFILYYDAANSSGCLWRYKTVEKELAYSGCTQTSRPRYQLSVNMATGIGGVRFTLAMNITTDIASSTIQWANAGPSGAPCLTGANLDNTPNFGWPDIVVSPA